MPQLLVIAAIGAGTYFGARWIRKKAIAFKADLERAAKARPVQTANTSKHPNITKGDVDELVKDPKTGVYRVDKD